MGAALELQECIGRAREAQVALADARGVADLGGAS